MAQEKNKEKSLFQKNKRAKWYLLPLILLVLCVPLFLKLSDSKHSLKESQQYSNAYQPDIIIYFQYDVTDSDIAQLKDELAQISGVKNVIYVSSTEASQRLFELDGTVTTDALPSSLEVYLTSPSQEIETHVANVAESKSYVFEVE